MRSEDCQKQNNPTADCHQENNRSVDCYSQYYRFESAKRLFLLWKTAVHLRAVCQGVIPVVANHGIGAWFAAKEGNPVPAILH
jgi:hypothetical protein